MILLFKVSQSGKRGLKYLIERSYVVTQAEKLFRLILYGDHYFVQFQDINVHEL